MCKICVLSFAVLSEGLSGIMVMFLPFLRGYYLIHHLLSLEFSSSTYDSFSCCPGLAQETNSSAHQLIKGLIKNKEMSIYT